MPTSLLLQVHTEAVDAEALNELALDLRSLLSEAELVGLTIEPPVSWSGGGRPGERSGVDPTLLGVVALSISAAKVAVEIVRLIETWVKSRRCSVRVQKRDGSSIVEIDDRRGLDERLLAVLLDAVEAGTIPPSPHDAGLPSPDPIDQS